MIPFNPCAIKGAGTEPASERPKPTLEMIEAVVANLNDRYSHRNHQASDHRYEALAWTAAFSGLREGELFALGAPGRRPAPSDDQRHEAGAERRQPTCRRAAQKTAAGNRMVVIPATLAAMLDEHLAEYVRPQPNALVFTSD